MAIDFIPKDVMHRVAVKFTKAFLPGAKKPYNLKTVHQPELDVHEIASKAAVYNITTAPKVIEEGLTAGMELMAYLVADGYKIKTPLFGMSIRVQGEYDGSESVLPKGVSPQVKVRAAAELQKYVAEHVTVEFDGMDEAEGHIGQAVDESSGQIDEVMTGGGILTIHGSGLKIEADEAHKSDAGLFFDGGQGVLVKAVSIAVNEPRTVKVVVPAGLVPGSAYQIKIVTQSSARHSGTPLKNIREVRSEFTLTAQ